MVYKVSFSFRALKPIRIQMSASKPTLYQFFFVYIYFMIFKAYVREARPPPPSRIIKTELNYYLQCMTVLRVPVL